MANDSPTLYRTLQKKNIESVAEYTDTVDLHTVKKKPAIAHDVSLPLAHIRVGVPRGMRKGWTMRVKDDIASAALTAKIKRWYVDFKFFRAATMTAADPSSDRSAVQTKPVVTAAYCRLERGSAMVKCHATVDYSESVETTKESFHEWFMKDSKQLLGRRAINLNHFREQRQQNMVVVLGLCWLLMLTDTTGFQISYGSSRSHPSRCTQLHLFFNGPSINQSSKPPRPKKSSFDKEWMKEQLRNQTTDFRLVFELSQQSNSPRGDSESTFLVLERANSQRDLRALVDMNVREYCRGPAVLPWDNLQLIGRFFDRLIITRLIQLSIRMKLSATEDSFVYVAKFGNGFREDCVAMIEVSLQPVLRERNPPPFPLPLSMKKLIASAYDTELQGWITNLLVVPEFRGVGYSKLLVAASEAVAELLWNCQSVHLHCDADPISGSIPRQLYRSMGYNELADGRSSVSIDGASLIYLSKCLR